MARLRTLLLAAAISAALGVAAAPLAAQNKELAHDNGQQAGKRSSAGTGHVITFDAPKGKYWLHAVRVHGARYGGGYNPKQTSFWVSVCDADMAELTKTEAAYSLFRQGAFKWIDIPLDEPVQVSGEFRIAVAFDPAQTRGVHVAWSEDQGAPSHSGFALPGQEVKPLGDGRDWMIRAVLSKRAPKRRPRKPDPAAKKRTAIYMKDFEFIAKTVRRRYPALQKKDIDWAAVLRAERPAFKKAVDDEQHLLNVYRLIAALQDTHSSVRETSVEVHVPSFDGQYGAGLWIASDRGRLLLRDWAAGHQRNADLVRGAELVEVNGRAAKLVREEIRTQLRRWHGWSSTHFLDARLSTQWFPFGERDSLAVRLLLPDGASVEVALPRWGPGGRGLSRIAATLPDGVTAEGLAVSTRLQGDLGYVRILGKMNDATRDEFFAAVDALRGVKGILLDCRGMGGGGDTPAWAMAGRFFTERTSNGTAGALEPTGDWQFDGPIVMLQDEREVSSAETFTWAMTETGRVVSVGRPTGGATIIPRMGDLPSGLARFRIGIHDRKTPIKGVQPEGAGTAPDVFVPYEPSLLARHRDPVRGVGAEVLAALVVGTPREQVVAAWAGVLGANAATLRTAASAVREALPAWLRDAHVRSAIDHEIMLCENAANPMPNFVGATARLAELAAIATLLGHDDAARRATDAPAGWTTEAAAQRAWETLVARGFPPHTSSKATFLRKHGETRYGAAVRE